MSLFINYTMNRKGLMKFGYVIAAIFLVSFILITLEPVSPGASSCKILPNTAAERQNYCPTCGIALAECAIKIDKNLDGDYKDECEGPGCAGCACAETFCTDWCQNDICDWEKGVTVCRAVCNIEEDMPHCVGLVSCPTAGEPCKGFLCGLTPPGGICQVDSDCTTGDCSVPIIINETEYLTCDTSDSFEACRFNEDCYDFVNGINVCCNNRCIETKADIDGNGVINMDDVVIVIIAFGSKFGDYNWNPDADLNKDEDINMIDIVIITLGFDCSLLGTV